MKVSIHPNRHKYLAGEESCISFTHKTATGQRTEYRGTVFLREVTLRAQPAGIRKAQQTGQRNVHAWAVGNEIISYKQRVDFRPLGEDYKLVTYHFNSGEFRILDTGENVTGMTFPYAYALGRDLYIKDNR